MGSSGNIGEPDVGDRVKGGWREFKGRVREKWSDLTDRDLDTYQGRKRDDLVGYIGQRTGSRREEVERDVDTFARDTGYRLE